MKTDQDKATKIDLCTIEIHLSNFIQFGQIITENISISNINYF